jgi:hypothetical protein
VRTTIAAVLFVVVMLLAAAAQPPQQLELLASAVGSGACVSKNGSELAYQCGLPLSAGHATSATVFLHAQSGALVRMCSRPLAVAPDEQDQKRNCGTPVLIDGPMSAARPVVATAPDTHAPESVQFVEVLFTSKGGFISGVQVYGYL